MRFAKVLLDVSAEKLMEKAGDCFDIAKTQHDIADEQHKSADKPYPSGEGPSYCELLTLSARALDAVDRDVRSVKSDGAYL